MDDCNTTGHTCLVSMFARSEGGVRGRGVVRSKYDKESISRAKSLVSFERDTADGGGRRTASHRVET